MCDVLKEFANCSADILAPLARFTDLLGEDVFFVPCECPGFSGASVDFEFIAGYCYVCVGS